MTRICLPIWMTSGLGRSDCRGDPPAEWILRIEQQGSFPVDEGRAGDRREDPVAGAMEAGGESTSQDAFLDPRFTLEESPIGGETGEFGAGARAAGRAVIGAARAKDEIARMRARDGWRAEELHVIHFGKTLRVDGQAQRPGEIGQGIDLG